MRRVNGDVDREVEHGEHDLGEVERLQLVVLAHLPGELGRVDPGNVGPGLEPSTSTLEGPWWSDQSPSELEDRRNGDNFSLDFD